MFKTKLGRIFSGLGIVLLVVIAGYLAVRPLHLRWGASAAEVSRAMPGDLAGRRWTRAITVNATPEQLWPWLAQWGQGRGGWYSYDWLENLFGLNIHSATRIMPEYQNPAIGDPICMGEGVCTSFVSMIEPQQWFAWQASDENGTPMWTYTLGLLPMDATHTRLIMRESFADEAMPAVAILILEIPDTVMMQKALHSVKQRAEGRPESAYTTMYEIALWSAALLMGLIAAGLFVYRQDWRKPLATGVAAVGVLLVITFLFPPLWLRGLFNLGLLAGLVWSFQPPPTKTEAY